MKLRVESAPDGYTDDKAAIMEDTDTETFIAVGCERAHHVSAEIAHRVNLYPSFIAVLEPFSSKNMGQLLIDALESAMQDQTRGAVVKGKLTTLINAVDVILKGAELHKERMGQ